jgi:FkbM family methyltransferase
MPELKLSKAFKLVRGLVWPDMDQECHPRIFQQVPDLHLALEYVSDFSACVQAGGNCGLWPIELAPRFGTVYSAEPHPDNFVALTVNTAELKNVVRMQCAFGYERGCVDMMLDRDEANNCGAFFVKPGGFIPTIRIDDLGLTQCGLISLDVEGREYDALRGADALLRFCRPVIVIEDKGLSAKFGQEEGECVRWLERDYGYQVVDRPSRDVILVPTK